MVHHVVIEVGPLHLHMSNQRGFTSTFGRLGHCTQALLYITHCIGQNLSFDDAKVCLDKSLLLVVPSCPCDAACPCEPYGRCEKCSSQEEGVR